MNPAPTPSASANSGPMPPDRARRRRIALVTLGLVAATLVSFLVGETHLSHTPAWAVALVLLLAAAKACSVALDYMDLRDAPHIWRLGVLTWIWVITGLIAVSSWLGSG